MIDTIITDTKKREDLFNTVDSLFEQLKSILFGVYLIHDLSEKTQNAIVSYGERLSSHIVATLIKGARRMNSRDFIRTEKKNGKHVLDADLTNQLVRQIFSEMPKVAVVPGFISRDKNTKETTNLGRGGSDYTAAIIAAALDAEVLEIWTDVDGFMTADPRVIKTAYTINELSYVEAMELCNFGAKVIYPPTIYPVCVKNIPIKVKNTFNPNHPGTLIKEKIKDDNKPIKGISSISGTTLITVSGLSMVGVIGVNRRIFSVLANNGISVFIVSQASSENSTSIGVRDVDAAAEKLNFTEKGVVATPTSLGEVFVGVYKPQSAKDLYGINDSGQFQKGGASATINSFRALLTSVPAAAHEVSFVEDETTAINSIKTTNGSQDAVYTLQGVRTNSISKGIYIINGKKVIVK